MPETQVPYEEKHIPVLFEELVESIDISSDRQNIIVDCTLGMAGHASEVIKKLNSGDIFVAFDADSKNLEIARSRIENMREDITIHLVHSNFGNLKEELEKRGIEKVTGIYYDLGLSSLHLDEAERGFSFMREGPLDMRLDKTRGKTAKEIVNGYQESELREIFMKYGESSQSNKVSNRIVERRRKQKFETTTDLAEMIDGGPKEKSKIFQAVRIEVNNELKNIEDSLAEAIELTQSSGKIFVISFHSLEDRIVKHIFKKESKDCICTDIICSCHHKKSLKILSKKPILPSEEEIKINPRSRSAKARVAQKI